MELAPKTWKEVSSKGGWKNIEKWLIDIYQNPHEFLSMDTFALILGPSGSGKSHQFRLLCEYLEIRIQWIEGHHGKEIIELLQKVYTSDLIGCLQETSGDKRIVLIDDFDIACAQDRMLASYLIQFVQSNKYKGIPLVTIGNSSHEKKFGELGRQVTPFKLSLLSIGDTFLYLEQCASYFKLELEETVILSIAQKCQGNYTKAFETIQCYTEQSLILTDEHTSFDLVMELPTETNLSNLFFEDTFGTLLRFHENLYLEIHRRISKLNDKKRWYGQFFALLLDLEIALSFEHKTLELTLGPFIHQWVRFCSEHPRKTTQTVDHEFTRLLSRMSLHKKHARKMIPIDYWTHSPYLIDRLSHNKKCYS
jgi:hypothetical protein